MSDRINKHLVGIAALIHDIGLLDGSCKNDEEWIAKTSRIIAEKSTEQLDSSQLERLATAHLRDKSTLDDDELVVAEAHELSLGPLLDDKVDNSGNDVLIPICEKVFANNARQSHYFKPQSLGLSEESFPIEERPSHKKDLLTPLVEQLQLLQPSPLACISDTLLSLLHVYASNVSCMRGCDSPISLYDHLHTSAAIATALYDFRQSEKTTEMPFLLVGGDMSGIQPYIAQIVSKNAARNLKGRSFYIKLLSDAIVRYLLSALELSRSNVIYNSGGCFYILAPNTSETIEKLQDATELIEERLFNTHGTTLYVAIDYVILSESVLRSHDGSLRNCWKELFLRRDSRKNNRFAKLMQQHYDLFFEPSFQGGDTMRDSVTGEEIPSNEKPIIIDDLTLRPINATQIELGKKLRETVCLVALSGDIPQSMANIVSINPLELGTTYCLVTDKSQLSKLARVEGVIDIQAFNDPNFVVRPTLPNASYRMGYYGGNQYGNNGTNFELMAGESNLKRLGVLRMDVDNLGHVFQSGLADNINSLSAMSALSRSLDYFFSGYLNTIWQSVDPDHSFIVYSGGDDLFIVGRWDVTIRLAKNIVDHFRRYTCSNPAFGLSGGVSIVKQKYPIMKAAEESSEEESRAKKHAVGNAGKNSFSMLGMAMNWDKEFPVVEKLKDQLAALVNENRMPSSFLGKIMAHYENAEIKNHKITTFKTIWMMAYDMARLKERLKKDDECVAIIDCCKRETAVSSSPTLGGMRIETDYHPLELWSLAARWAELEIRN